MEFRKDINGLRAVAVLLVLLYHFGMPQFGAGFIGVDVFFVISGFLMTRIIFGALDEGRFSLTGFYKARLARLYPALLATVSATLVLGVLFVEPVALAAMARDGIATLAFVSNVLFWQQSGYFAASAQEMWFLHSWSLSVEWQFYLVYPLVLTASAPFLRSTGARTALLGAGIAASLGVAVAAGSLAPSEKLASAGFYLLPARAWELLAGGLVALHAVRLRRLGVPARRAMEAAGLAAIAASLALFSGEATPWPSWNALLPVAGAVLVLAADAPRSLLSAPPLQRLGDWSYSIYLWHWPLVVALAYFGLGGAWTVAFFAASIAAGRLSFVFIEKPARAWLAARDARPRVPALRFGAFTAASLAVVAACGAVMAGKGFPHRSPALAAAYDASVSAAADYGYPLDRCGGVTTFGRQLKLCEVGLSSPGSDILVIGDSFAEMWYARVAALETRLRNHAVVFATKGGCVPVRGVERVQPGMDCGAFGEAALELARSGRFRTVVFAAMWTSYFTRGGSNTRFCSPEGCAATATEAGFGPAMDSFARQVADLRHAGKEVVVMTTSPYPNVDVGTQMRRRALAGERVDSEWSFDFAAIRDASMPVDGALLALAGRGATVIDLEELLCREGACPSVTGGAPLYTDTSHLRSAYVVEAGAFLDPVLLDPAPVDSAAADSGFAMGLRGALR